MKNLLFQTAKKVKNLVLPTLGNIYMLHRCAPLNKQNLFWNEHMKVSPQFLRKFLLEQKQANEFISLDELYSLSRTGKKLTKPFVVLTFDDGYLDNYEYALPIFEELQIPFAVYVTNSFPNRTVFLWWYVLEGILQNNDVIKLATGEVFTCKDKLAKEELFLQLRKRILGLQQDDLETEFQKLFCNYNYDNVALRDELCLSWAQIREMANSKYCTIAAHTSNHRNLRKLSTEQLEYEILQGKKELEDKIGREVKHFSYPFGSPNEVGQREIKFIKNSGFATACYSARGRVNNRNIKNPLELPRVFLGELER